MRPELCHFSLTTHHVARKKAACQAIIFPPQRTFTYSFLIPYGQKNGYWKEYSGVEVLADEGSYKNDLKVGIWKHYACPDRLVEEYDYTSGQDIPLKLHFGCRYPSIAVELGLSGTVHFSYKLNSDCTVSDFKILTSPHKSFSEELTRHFAAFANAPASGCTCKERQEVSFLNFSLQ